MRIPHVVSKVVLGAYILTPEELELMEEADKAPFPAANFTWDTHIVPTLKFIVLQRLAQLFILIKPHIDNKDSDVLQQDVNTLMEILPMETDMNLTVPVINYEIYWERCCKERWPEVNILAEDEKQFWKNTYLKMYLEDYFEKALPKEYDVQHAADLAKLLQNNITRLNIKELQTTDRPPMPHCRDGNIRDECIRPDLDIPLNHIPLESALSKLKNLTHFRIVFSVQNLMTKFDWRAFRFSLSDCESICAGLKEVPNIKVLCINRTLMDSDRVKVFARFIAKKDSIEEIDFSHCHIGDEGLWALGGLLMEHPKLKVMSLRNNKFTEEGMKGLGNALEREFKAPLVTLDVGMNYMTDMGANYLAAGLVRCCEKPTEVVISGCCFRGFAAQSIARMIHYNRCILKIDISANDFSGEAETLMMEAIEANRHILQIDLRETALSEENKVKIREYLSRNKQLREHKTEIIDEEIPPLFMDDPEYLIWEFNPTNPYHEPGHYPLRSYEG